MTIQEEGDKFEVGQLINIYKPGAYEPSAEIVQVTCPVCGEEFIGSKREAGGFLSGHEVYHKHELAFAVVIDELGGA